MRVMETWNLLILLQEIVFGIVDWANDKGGSISAAYLPPPHRRR